MNWRELECRLQKLDDACTCFNNGVYPDFDRRLLANAFCDLADEIKKLVKEVYLLQEEKVKPSVGGKT